MSAFSRLSVLSSARAPLSRSRGSMPAGMSGSSWRGRTARSRGAIGLARHVVLRAAGIRTAPVACATIVAAAASTRVRTLLRPGTRYGRFSPPPEYGRFASRPPEYGRFSPPPEYGRFAPITRIRTLLATTRIRTLLATTRIRTLLATTRIRTLLATTRIRTLLVPTTRIRTLLADHPNTDASRRPPEYGRFASRSPEYGRFSPITRIRTLLADHPNTDASRHHPNTDASRPGHRCRVASRSDLRKNGRRMFRDRHPAIAHLPVRSASAVPGCRIRPWSRSRLSRRVWSPHRTQPYCGRIATAR